MRVIDNYRRYLEHKAGQNAGVSGRITDLRGQALLWVLPTIMLAGLDYLIKISEPYRTILFILAGILFLAGFIFASYIFVVAGAKIDHGQAVRDRRDDGI